MKIDTIGLVARSNDENAHKIAASFAQKCIDEGIKPVLSSDSVETIASAKSAISHNHNLSIMSMQEISHTADVCVVLGGDGTFLGAASGLYQADNCPLLGINLGHLGFLTDVPQEAIHHLIADLRQDKFKAQDRNYYLATLCDNNEQCWQQHFLNDAVIQRNADEKMIRFDVDSGQWRVASTRADGLIVSTPTGSTAYNLSTGGPILHPNIDALIISPICPHNLAFRPVVVPPKDIHIRLITDGHLSIDGRKSHVMKAGNTVKIEQSAYALKTLVNRDYNFFDVLREKFGWDRNLQNGNKF